LSAAGADYVQLSMKLYGVCNASPDSFNTDSIVVTVDEAMTRAKDLLESGADAIDLGGQGSTFQATQVDVETEWSRMADLIPALAGLGVELSVDTWNVEVMRRSLDAGATVMNAADALQQAGMWELAAERQVPVVLPFMLGVDPLHLEHVHGDAVDVMCDWFDAKLNEAKRWGIRDNLIIDPGTGFAPLGWEWESRYHYQKHIYSNLDRLRVFGLPVYIAMPWRRTDQHDELLEIVLRQDVDYGRVHYPAHIRSVHQSVSRPEHESS
jgi:dihydropteroate synthase